MPAVSAKHVLIVDANGSRRKQTAFGLRCAGFAVAETADPSAARSQIARHFPNLLLICVALLDGGVQEFVQGLRETAETRELPVAVLADRARRSDSKAALASGIDDFLVQPIAPEEFVARIDVAARSDAPPNDATTFAGLKLDADRGSVSRGHREALLSPTETQVLQLFMSHAEQVIPRSMLMFRVWGDRLRITSRTVDVSVCRLRRALEQLGCGELLQTINRRGYRLSQRPEGVDWRRAEQMARHDAPGGESDGRRA